MGGISPFQNGHPEIYYCPDDTKLLYGFLRPQRCVLYSSGTPELQKFLKFQWGGMVYAFTCLPNGLSSAPRVFTKLMKPLSWLYRSNSYKIHKSPITASPQIRPLAHSPKGGLITGVVLYSPGESRAIRRSIAGL